MAGSRSTLYTWRGSPLSSGPSAYRHRSRILRMTSGSFLAEPRGGAPRRLHPLGGLQKHGAIQPVRRIPNPGEPPLALELNLPGVGRGQVRIVFHQDLPWRGVRDGPGYEFDHRVVFLVGSEDPALSELIAILRLQHGLEGSGAGLAQVLADEGHAFISWPPEHGEGVQVRLHALQAG